MRDARDRQVAPAAPNAAPMSAPTGRWAGAAGVGLAVLLAHAGVAFGFGDGRGDGVRVLPMVTLTVPPQSGAEAFEAPRLPEQLPEALPPPTAAADLPLKLAKTLRPLAPLNAAPQLAALLSEQTSSPTPQAAGLTPTAAAAPPTAADTSPPSANSPDASASAAAPPLPDPPPVYRTKPPPSVTLRYTLSKGLLSATGELRWKLNAGAYEAVLEGSVLGMDVLDWRSTGRIDAAGLAPTRFTDQRRGRAVRAANFQRDKALITYSGPSAQYPLYPGSQDRLSWMLQLAAIANARSAPWTAGERITLFVTGARGDASIWDFTVQGREKLSLPGGTADVWHLARVADGPRDNRVDVWIAPAMQNMPVRARMGSADGEALELRLTAAGSGS
jgi:Protein of unknown function (DUF3108)